MPRSRTRARSDIERDGREPMEERAASAPPPLLSAELQRALGNQRFGALVARVRANQPVRGTAPALMLQRDKAAVTDGQVRASAASPFTKMLGKYSLICGGTTITLSYTGLGEVGHITGGMNDQIASVTNVKVGSEFQKQGLGKLLAAAFYAYWEGKGATKFNLGTVDSSGGFWGHLGMSSSAIPVATAWAKLGTISVERDLKRGEPEFTDYTKRIIY